MGGGGDSRAVIDTVFFDAAGTLIEVAEPVGETYARAARAAGVAADADALGAAFRAAFVAAPPLAFPGAAPGAIRLLEREWWRERVLDTFAMAGVDAPADRLDRAFRTAFDHFARGAAWRVFADVAPALAALRARGLRLAVVSNFDARLRTILRDVGLRGALDHVVVSSECGAAKPDRRIFAAALRASGARADSTLHVGDSLELDVVGARAAGLAALRIDRSQPPAGGSIASLAEVAERLNR